ncbi:MAG: TraX family protein [Clostridiaceae bacterium]|nr:TraX family protein [Clostridiaceae bacterium]
MLKLLACFFMLLDHLGYYLDFIMPDGVVMILRTIGRLAFPIFAWSVARGMKRTHNPLRYFIRMCIFAGASELLIRLAYGCAGLTSSGTNVMVTFALSIALVTGYRLFIHSYLDMVASLRPISPTPQTAPTPPRYDIRVNIGGIELDPRIGLPLGLLTAALAVTVALWLQPDYGLYGLLTVLAFYIVYDVCPEKDREKRAIQIFILLNALFLPIRILFMNWPADWSILQCFSVAALPICYYLDRDKKPGPAVKYAYYLFYPLHIVLLCLIRSLL